MDIQVIKSAIENGNAVLGIEMGSTRIKAVLIDEKHNPVASGSHGWENRFENGVWTYHLDDVWAGLQDAYKNLKADVEEKYGVKLTKLKAMGFSAMMHGYLAFDKEDKLLAPFRTWRNTNAYMAGKELSSLFNFNVPMLETVFEKIGTPYTAEQFADRLDRAKFWLEQCAPDQVNRLRTTRNFEVWNTLDENEKKTIELLHAYIAKDGTPSSTCP